jgi:hypothetical protein
MCGTELRVMFIFCALFADAVSSSSVIKLLMGSLKITELGGIKY